MGFVTADPIHYALLSVSRLRTFFVFWPEANSGTLSNVVRVLSFALALPFMLAGLAMAARQWRRWSLLHACRYYPKLTQGYYPEIDPPPTLAEGRIANGIVVVI